MTTRTEFYRFLFRGGTAAAVAALNEVPLARELVVETNTGKAKLGDGTTAYNALPYWNMGGVSSFNTRTGAVTLTYSDVTGALGFTPTTVSGAVSAVAAAIGTGLAKSNGTALSTATAGTDYTVSVSGGFGALVTAPVSPGVLTVTTGAIANAYAGDTGEYFINAINSAGLTTVATAASRFEFYPLIPLAQDITISALAIYVTTGVASALSRVGIYADNNGKPDGAALICDSGALDCATSSTAREGAVSVTLTKGTRYWLCILSNNTQTLRAINLAATMALPTTDLSGTSIRNVRRASLTYGALPSTAPATTNSASTHVAIWLKYT